MFEALLGYVAHVRHIPAETSGEPNMGLISQHEIPEMLEYGLHVRVGVGFGVGRDT